MLSTILTDLRMAVRAARRQPAFTAVVVATLALGIGANTAMFALIHAALLKPLPYTDPDRLVLARRTIGTRLLMWNSAPDFYDYLEQATDLEALSATRPEAARVTLTGGERPEILRGGEVSYDLFSTLGVSPINGRLFTPDEGRAGAPYVALITDGLARRRFGDAASAVGRTLPLTGIGPSPVLATVVGVMPATYRFLYDADLWMPMHRGERDGPETRQFHNWVLVGRLKPGASIAGAQRQVDVIATRLQQEYPSSNKGKGLRLDPLQSALFEAQTPRLLLLMGAVGLVLFIACANVAGLLLARGVSRRSELAVRAALGASKLRIAGQLLTESLLLAAVSGVLGTVLALGLQRVLPVASGLAQSGVEVRGLNPMVLLFALALSIVTALLSGVVPALRASSHSLVGHLAPGIRSTESRGGTRLRSVLVVGQVAVSLALLVGAGLLLRSFAKLATTDLGFNPTHLLTGSVRVPEADPARRIQFFNELQKSFAAIPGVTAVAFNSHIPIRDAAGDPPMWRSDRPPVDASDTGTADLRIVLPGSVRAMGIPLLLGRDITDSDNIDAPPVLVINQVMARTLFPGESALGGRITVAGADRDFEVVGVVGDARIDSVGRPASMTMYASYSQVPRPSMNFLLRTALPPDAVAQSVRRVVETRNPDIAVENLVSMDEILGDSLTAYRVTTVTLGLFSIVALLLSSLGLYGVLAYYVSTRIHEIGVRMALGAEQSAILRHVAAQSATMVVPGIVLGVVAALAGGRLVQSMLYNVEPTDAATFVGVTAALGLVALVATAWPAWRAARTDPARALRSE